MNILPKKIIWATGQAPSETQIVTVQYRKQSDADVPGSYVGLGTVQVLSSGDVIGAPSVSGLLPNTAYVFRFVNNNPAGGSMDYVYTTPEEFTVSAVSKKYYHNSELIYSYPGGGFRSAMIPPKIGAFYALENTLSDWFENFDNVILSGVPDWAKRLDSIGLQIKTTSDMVQGSPDLDQMGIMGTDGGKSYALGCFFYIATADFPSSTELPLISLLDGAGNGVYVYVDRVTKYVYWQQKKGAVTESIVSDRPINLNAWNQVLVYRPNGTGVGSKMWLNFFDTFTGGLTSASAFIGDVAVKLFVGGKVMGNVLQIPSVGGIYKYFYYTDSAIDNNLAGKYMDPPFPTGVLENPADVNDKYVITKKNMIVITDDRIVCTVPQDAPYGVRKFYIQNSSNVFPFNSIEVLQFLAANVPIVVDFEADPVAAENTFKAEFYAMAKAWGGANGGVHERNVYIKDGLLVFEAHGDTYDGALQGYNRDGSPKVHTIPDDPRLGLPWIRRVGAVVSTKKYCGYGRYTIVAKLPPEIGVAPAFWTFHYGEVYPQDPRYEQLLAQGLHKQGGFADGRYVVENNEIDIELPSHDLMYVFATEVELGTAHFHKVFSGERIGIDADPDVSKRGTWQLVNTSAPNSLSSWTKVNSEIHRLAQPTKNNIKANTWKGELGAGNGITFGTDPYSDEYFAQLTAVGEDMWDGEFHEFAIEWRAASVLFFVDGVQVQVADDTFTPDVPGRWTVGMWFPSQPNSTYPWLVNPNGGWAGPVANWKYQKMLVKKITFSPYTSVEAGGVNRLVGETYPFDGFKQLT